MNEEICNNKTINSLPSKGGQGEGTVGPVALFVGSFDPFHEGHRSIVERALDLFDRVVIGIGVNPEKTYMFTPLERKKKIEDAFIGNERVVVRTYTGLTIDFARFVGANYIVKGVRNADDFTYEQVQAVWNKEHGGIETILFFAEPGLEEVSSTKIRKEML